MTAARARRSAVPATAVAVMVGVLLAGAAGLQRVREARYPPYEHAGDALYITSGATIGRLTKGYSALAADLYWIRTIQYYGGLKRKLDQRAAASRGPEGSEYELLHPLLDLTTTLDPRFNVAYRFGAIFLAEPYPGGAGRPDLAIALLAKGLQARPDKWEYMQDIGFVHYWWRQDYTSAGEWFNRASQVAGAPWWLRSLAATTLAEGGDRRSSRLMWESIYASAEIDWLRRDAERRLLQLRALDEIDALQLRVDRYASTTAVEPTDWLPLVRVGLLRAIPADPAGTPYEIDAGRVRISARSALAPLPTEPKRQPPIS